MQNKTVDQVIVPLNSSELVRQASVLPNQNVNRDMDIHRFPPPDSMSEDIPYGDIYHEHEICPLVCSPIGLEEDIY